MQKKKILMFLSLFLFLAVALGAFLTTSSEESENRGSLWGTMEIAPTFGNTLGDVITIKVEVSYDRDRVEFDHRQIPKNIEFYPFELRDTRHTSKRSGKYTVETWEFKVQYLMGGTPVEYKIPAISLQYKKKEVSYISDFEISGALVSFVVLTSENSSPDFIIKKLPFGPEKNTTALFLFSLSGIFTLLGIGLVVAFFLRNKTKKKEAPEFEPIDEFISRYDFLYESFKRGENRLSVLHKLYLLLRSFFKERRGTKLQIGWEDSLDGGEKVIIERLQALYGEDSISQAHARELLEEAQKILRGG